MNILSVGEKYPALRLISILLKALGWLTGLVTIPVAVILLFKGGDGMTRVSFIIAIVVCFVGAFISIGQFAMAESVIVLVDIEENTRRSHLDAGSKGDSPVPLSAVSKADSPVPLPKIAERHLVDNFEIIFNGDHYVYNNQNFWRLADAVKYAKTQLPKS